MSTCSTGPDFSSGFPAFISAGDILTDLVRGAAPDGANAPAGAPGMDSHWRAHPGGAGWNVARAVARLGLPTACAGALGTDNFSDELWNASVARVSPSGWRTWLMQPKCAHFACARQPSGSFAGSKARSALCSPMK